MAGRDHEIEEGALLAPEPFQSYRGFAKLGPGPGRLGELPDG